VSYAVPVVSATSGGTLQTQGGSIITLSGSQFGPSSLTGAATRQALGSTLLLTYGGYNSTDCNVSSSSSAVCASVSGMGNLLDVALTVANQRSATLPGAVSYTLPAITSITCQSTLSALVPTTGCWLNIDGTNFGPIGAQNVVTASLRSSSVSMSLVNCSLTTAHSRIQCWAPPGVGTSYAAIVNVALRQNVTSVSTVSFTAPVITSLSGAVTSSTQGGGNVTITGESFGPVGTVVTVTYDSGPNVYSPSCSVAVAHTVIVCPVLPGVGSGLRWTVTVGGQSATSAATTAYNAPTIVSVVSSPVTATAGQGNFTLVGADFGPASPQIATTVTYSNAVFGTVYSATGCLALNHSAMRCFYAAGVGVNFSFTATVGGLSSARFGTTIRYAQPVVIGVSGGPFGTIGGDNIIVQVGCAALAGGGLLSMANRKRTHVQGSSFGFSTLVTLPAIGVNYGSLAAFQGSGAMELQAVGCSRVSDTTLSCTMVGGVGSGWYISVSTASQTGVSATGLGGYPRPVLRVTPSNP
jgi:hypothetical protein